LLLLIAVYTANVLMWRVLWNIMGLLMTSWTLFLVEWRNKALALGLLNFLFGLITAYWNLTIFGLPVLVLSIYAVFGSDFFLFAWTDDFGIWAVTRFIPGASFYHKVTVTLLLVYIAITGLLGAYPLLGYQLLMFYIAMAWSLEYAQWYLGVDAARRIDPTWNKHRGMLYPAIFYNRGWREDEPYPE